MDYEAVYNNLCANRKSRGLVKEEGYEIHHIKPKSMGGCDSADNLVKFTYKEHFLAHKLLTKFTTGLDHYRMLKAFMLMSGTGKYKFSRDFSFQRNQYLVQHKLHARSFLYKEGILITGIQDYVKGNPTVLTGEKIPKVLRKVTLMRRKGIIAILALYNTLGEDRGLVGLSKCYKGSYDILKELEDIRTEGRTHYLTDKGKELLNSIPQGNREHLMTVTTRIREYLMNSSTIKHKKGVGAAKKAIDDHNKLNPDNLKKLVYLDNKYYWQDFN